MSEISNAIKQICAEKGLSYDAVLLTIEAALAAAYRKDFGNRMQNIKVEFDPETAHIKAFDVKTVVEDMPEELEAAGEKEPEEKKKEGKKAKEVKADAKPKKLKEEKSAGAALSGKGKDEGEEIPEEEARRFNPKTEIEIKDAIMIKPDAKIGDEIRLELPVTGEFGRMAAQTAKQVIIQKLREAERDMVFGEFKDKEKEVVSGIIQRREGRVVLIDLGKAIGILPAEEQIFGENYRPGSRIKIYVREVKMGPRGAEIILSRTSEEILRKVFYLEIPEIANGLIEIKAVAREAGSRSKVAVATDAENVDPIGSCVGQRGSRIQTIISELGGEKVDIIEYDSSQEKFIMNALSPAKIIDIRLDEETRRATVMVNPDQFSLAIGKNGQNVRLAAHLTGWKIDIVENKAKKEEGQEAEEEGGAGTEEKGAEKDEMKKAEAEAEMTALKVEAETKEDEITEESGKEKSEKTEVKGEKKSKEKAIKEKSEKKSKKKKAKEE